MKSKHIVLALLILLIAACSDPLPTDKLSYTGEWRSSEMVLLILDEFGGKTALSIDDLKDRPFIGLNSRGPLGHALAKYLEAAGIEPNVVAWTETYHVAKALVASGAGIPLSLGAKRFANHLAELVREILPDD